MFGYVLPFKADLRVCQWTAYRAYYCGLCQELKREYGFVSRLLLNYDMVTLALLADGLADIEPPVCAQRCVANPVEKRPMCGASPGLALAADSLVLAAYYKAEDDVADERFLKKLAARALRGLLGRARRKAAGKRPDIDAVLARQTAAQSALEKRGCADADEAADPTAQMTAAMFLAASCETGRAAGGAAEARALSRLGLFLGKVLYYLDAAEDYDEDKARGAYNVFLLRGLNKEEAADEARRLCRMCAGEMALCYNLLTIPGATHKPILDNILFLGLPQSIRLAGQKREKPRGAGRIDQTTV